LASAIPQPERPNLGAILKSPAMLPGAVATLGILVLFWGFLCRLPTMWLQDDYYTHGFLIPAISGYVIYRWWPRIKHIPVKAGWPALLFLPFVLLAFRAAALSDIQQLVSVCFVATLLLGVWFVGGFQWALALCLPILYLVFMLPIWSGAIDVYTNPLQLLSTKVAFHMLNLFGQDPLFADPTSIQVKAFMLNVEVPCSGLKLVLAVTAFTAFFLMIADLKWWGRAAMVALILPLCLFINGLRIALIGVVGGQYGDAAGHQFHDWSGWITLLVCFFILFKAARALGWKE
jgi:exosortase